MRQIVAKPLDNQGFKSFGSVIEAPGKLGRIDYSDALGNGRTQANASLSTVQVAPLNLPLDIKLMERHEFSSQSFIPLKVSRYLVIVAPQASKGGPDVSRACAFLAKEGQGITYRMGIWHHGLTVLDELAEFAILMWRDGTCGDEEFVTLSDPFTVVVPDGFSEEAKSW